MENSTYNGDERRTMNTINLSAKNLGVLIGTIILSIGGSTILNRATKPEQTDNTNQQQIKEKLDRIEAKLDSQNEFDKKMLERTTAVETEIKNLKDLRRR